MAPVSGSSSAQSDDAIAAQLRGFKQKIAAMRAATHGQPLLDDGALLLEGGAQTPRTRRGRALPAAVRHRRRSRRRRRARRRRSCRRHWRCRCARRVAPSRRSRRRGRRRAAAVMTAPPATAPPQRGRAAAHVHQSRLLPLAAATVATTTAEGTCKQKKCTQETNHEGAASDKEHRHLRVIGSCC